METLGTTAARDGFRRGRSRHGPRLVARLVGLAAVFLSWGLARAQVTLDGSVGPAGPLTGPNYVIGSELGQTLGDNLFQSFGQFNVHAGESATFTGPGSITNIVARVTGGLSSSIDGFIDTRTSMPSANFFLLNPSGVLFGPNAALSVGGAFHVGTADYLRFADDAKFFANLSRQSTLTVAEPVAFGFLGPTAASISINGSNLTVDAQRTLSVVGGDIRVTGATLTAPGGRVQIDGVGSGEVPLQTLDAGSASRRGAIEITGSTLDASGDRGGTLVIRGGQLLVDGSSVMANTLGDTSGAPVGIDLQASGQLTITNGATVATAASAAGRGGDIRMTADRIDLTGGAPVGSSTFGLGRGGDIQLTANHLNFGGAALSSQTFGDGSGGDVSIDAGSMTLGQGSMTSQNSSFGAARGGTISIRARDSIDVSGTSIFSQVDFSGAGGAVTVSASSLRMDEGAGIQAFTQGEGRGGDVSVGVGNLSLTGAAQIGTTTLGPGRAGNLTVTATGSALIADAGSVSSGSFSEGSLSDVTAHFGSLTLTRGAVIQAGVFAGTTGGNLTVTATDSMVISDQAGISSQAFTQDVGSITVSTPRLLIDNGFISTSTLEVGRAGRLSLSVGSLTLTNGGQIASSSIGQGGGAGGNIHVTATESITISGTSPTGASPIPEPFKPFIGDASSGIFSTASSDSPNAGPAGSITLSTPKLTLADGGTLSVATTGAGNAGQILLDLGAMTAMSGAGIASSTSGAGNAGDISINATAASLTGGGRIDSGTTSAGQGGTINLHAANSLSLSGGAGLFSNAGGTGPGGDINVTARQVELLGGSTISASSTGSAEALAGNVNIVFGDTLRMDGSSIATSSLFADGGNIAITSTGSVLILTNSQITTSVQSGVGAGGNITLGSHFHPLSFVVLANSGILANAFGGAGGNIGIFADVYLTSGGLVSASSALSAPGTINVEARITDLSGSLAELPDNVLQAANLLRAACTSRVAEGRASSLVVAGREGVPPEPEGLLWSPLGATLGDLGATLGEEYNGKMFPQFAGLWLGSNCAR